MGTDPPTEAPTKPPVVTKWVQKPCCPASVAYILKGTENDISPEGQFGKRVLRLETDAFDVKDNAVDTKERAEDLLEKLKKFNETMNAKLHSLEDTLGKLSKADDDVKSALVEAEKILAKLKKREIFNENKAAAEKEHGSSENATRIADDLAKKAEENKKNMA